MRTVGVRDLKLHASEIVRSIREEHQSVDVTYRGRVVARIIPMDEEEVTASDPWADLDALAIAIAERWPQGVSAVEAVRDVRREL